MNTPRETHVRALALALVLAVSALSPTVARAERFRMGLPTPPSHVWTIEANAFASDFERLAQGEHSIAVFPAGQLGNDAQMLQQLQTGALDIAFMPLAELANRVPEFGALYAPYLADDVEGAARILRSQEARSLLDQLPARLGIVGVGYALGGMRQIVARRSVRSAEGLRGLKLRITPLEPIQDFYTLLGVAPIPLPIGSVYDALANGQIDAIDIDMENALKQSYYALGETLILSNHMMFPMVGLISGPRWRSMNPELREMISEQMQQHLEIIASTYVEAEVEYEAGLRETGIEVRKVGADFFGAAVAAWEEKWLKRAPVLRELRRLAGKAAAE
jgi:TRAP-type C4-dicarboxylate transport system substrate-binding protein